MRPFSRRLGSLISRLAGLALYTVSSVSMASNCADDLLKLHGIHKASEVFVRPSEGIKQLDVKLIDVKAQLLGQLKHPENTKSLFYVVSPDNRVFLVEDSLDLAKENVWTAKALIARKGAEPVEWTFPIKEAGEVKWSRDLKDKKAGSFEFRQSYGVQLSSEEDTFTKNYIQAAIDAQKLDPQAEKLRIKRTVPLAHSVKCAEILNKKTSARSFITAKLGADFAILTAGIMIQAPQRFDVLLVGLGAQEKDENRDYDGDMLATDYSTGVVNNFFKSWVGYVATTSGVQALTKRFGTLGSSIIMRSGATVTSVALQTAMYSAMTDNDAKSIGMYNLGYSVFSIGKSHLIDGFIVNKLPEMVYNACLRNPATRFIFGQGSVRIVEGLASTVLYLGGRDVFMKFTGDKQKDTD